MSKISNNPNLCMLKRPIISKAFWLNFLVLVGSFATFGIGRRWRNLICVMLSTSSTQILLNGEPNESITRLRWLCHGEPLSPNAIYFCYGCSQLPGELCCWLKSLLQPLAIQQAKHGVSFYANDAIVFLRPSNIDVPAISKKEMGNLKFHWYLSAVHIQTAGAVVTDQWDRGQLHA